MAEELRCAAELRTLRCGQQVAAEGEELRRASEEGLRCQVLRAAESAERSPPRESVELAAEFVVLLLAELAVVSLLSSLQ